MRDRFFGSSLTVSANQGVERNLISAYRLTYDCAASRLHDPLEKNDVIETGFSYDQIEVLPGQLRKIRSATSYMSGRFCSSQSPKKQNDGLSPAHFALISDSPNVKTFAEEGRDAHQLLDSAGAPVACSIASKKSEPMLRRYFYDTLASYLSLYIRPEDQVVEIEPRSKGLGERFANYRAVSSVAALKIERRRADYILLNGTIHYERDIQEMLNQLRDCLEGSERILFVYYSMLWKPLARFASKVGMRSRTPEQNWIAHEDLENFCYLTGLEIIRRDVKLLCPIRVPLLANLLNRYLAPLPFFRLFTMLNIVIARPMKSVGEARPSVSVIVPARNESGNINNILVRCPMMGPEDEIIFVEGNSTDDTWEKIQQAASAYRGSHRLVLAQQKGRGKGDAVRLGFELATRDILMILDADLTTPPEELPKFYNAIARNRAEFVNGSRLVYPMEKEAMRFFNIVANKFFAAAFSFVLGQRLKDTLCGTKVISRAHYKRLAAAREFFGDFDPFGDFDLLFGAARMGLKIVEVPVHYHDRKYGTTNIQRWRHGLILLRMLLFAARRLKFLGHETLHAR